MRSDTGKDTRSLPGWQAAALLLAIALMAWCSGAAAQTIATCPVRVLDGRTVRFSDGQIGYIPGIEVPRLNNASCFAERIKGSLARSYLDRLLCRSGPPILVADTAGASDPGLVIARPQRGFVSAFIEGRNVADIMISSGLASRARPKNGWCRR